MTLPTKQTATTTALRPSKNLVNLPGIWILEWGYSDIFETASKVCETRRIPVTIPIRGVAEHTQQQPLCVKCAGIHVPGCMQRYSASFPTFTLHETRFHARVACRIALWKATAYSKPAAAIDTVCH